MNLESFRKNAEFFRNYSELLGIFNRLGLKIPNDQQSREYRERNGPVGWLNINKVCTKHQILIQKYLVSWENRFFFI